jgi:hypothetical protein
MKCPLCEEALLCPVHGPLPIVKIEMDDPIEPDPDGKEEPHEAGRYVDATLIRAFRDAVATSTTWTNAAADCAASGARESSAAAITALTIINGGCSVAC